MALSSTIYNTIFKRTSTFALASAVSVLFFERTLDLACETIFDKVNAGKQWKDIKDKL